MSSSQGGGLGVPVPADDPDLASGGTQSSLTPQPPWQSIPKFIPGSTNVQEYVQKLKFLAAMWPVEHLEQLAPRAALLVEGSAFRKVARLDPAKLKVANQTGIALLVDAIGGSWGSTELEERYEFFEKALYGTIQRNDESHDSYLSRMEANFVELLSRNTSLEEVQAYVLLRQSTLPAEDKKKILLEHGGDLKYKPVVKSFRLLGSKFFSEFQSGRSTTKVKVYDVNVTEAPENDSSDVGDRAFHANSEDFEPELDFETVEALAAQEDADAMLICAFETELEEFFQDTPEMHDAMTSYMEARSRLLEKRKNRGFWPTKGLSRGKGFKGKSKGRKGRDREQLLARIARSHCRKCGALGHWKAECPLGADKGNSGSTAAANVAMEDPSNLEDEVYSEVESASQAGGRSKSPVHMSSLHECYMAISDISMSDRCKLQHRMSKFSRQSLPNTWNKLRMGDSHRLGIGKSSLNNLGFKNEPPKTHAESVQSSSQAVSRMQHEILLQPPLTSEVCARHAEEPVAMSASVQGSTHAILDTGASRCIVGEKVLKCLQTQLPEEIQRKLKKTPSQIKFRFGNNESLTSSYRVHFPLKAKDDRTVWLAVEVVTGNTPFLFSKRAFKMLGGTLNTSNDTCCMHRLHPFCHPPQNQFHWIISNRYW